MFGPRLRQDAYGLWYVSGNLLVTMLRNRRSIKRLTSTRWRSGYQVRIVTKSGVEIEAEHPTSERVALRYAFGELLRPNGGVDF